MNKVKLFAIALYTPITEHTIRCGCWCFLQHYGILNYKSVAVVATQEPYKILLIMLLF